MYQAYRSIWVQLGYVPANLCRKIASQKYCFLRKNLHMKQFCDKVCSKIGLSLFYEHNCFKTSSPNQVYNWSTGPVNSAWPLCFSHSRVPPSLNAASHDHEYRSIVTLSFESSPSSETYLVMYPFGLSDEN